jgi:hypothetical protein
MAQFINSGRVIELALWIVLLEIAALLVWQLWRRQVLAAPDVLANLCAAAGLLGAGELLIAHAAWPLPACALSAALVAHIVALRLRWGSHVSAQAGPPHSVQVAFRNLNANSRTSAMAATPGHAGGRLR